MTEINRILAQVRKNPPENPYKTLEGETVGEIAWEKGLNMGLSIIDTLANKKPPQQHPFIEQETENE